MNRMIRRDFLRRSTAAAGMIAGWAGSTPGAEAKPARVRVGQIGTYHAHADGKMAALRHLPDDYEVVGVVEPDPALRRAAENNPAYRGLAWMTEEQLLHTPGLKVVAVETEVSDLVPTARRCVAAGMHLHMDKPAGENLEEFRKLLDDATARRLCVQMGYMFRWNPAFRFCFQAVRQGWLGRIFEINGVMCKQAAAEERRRNLAHPGAVMFELGCHLIDAMVSVLGRPSGVTGYRRALAPEQDSLVDNQLAVFEYPTAMATIRVSMTDIGGGQRRQFVVCGTEGTVEIRPLEPPRVSLTLDRARGEFAKGPQEVLLPKSPGRYEDQLRQLARIARGEVKPEYSPAHDLLVQELVLRASGQKAT